MSLPRVLVIDDSTSICLFISHTLQQAGYEVNVALNGRDGFAKIMTFRPHCLILDVLLPDSNGYALCRSLRQNASTQRLPLILISSKNAELDRNYGLRQGANRYLPKPFTSDALLQNVREVLPESFRPPTHPSMPAVQPSQQTSQAILKLIPRRVLSQDSIQTGNPLASTPVIKDQQVRRIFAEIDGKKTVARLATVTGFDTQEVFQALHVLLRMKAIRLYNEAGQPVENAL